MRFPSEAGEDMDETWAGESPKRTNPEKNGAKKALSIKEAVYTKVRKRVRSRRILFLSAASCCD
jgi:hypothetical protein